MGENSEKKRTFEKPTDWDQLYPGRFMKAGEFQGKKPTLTITSVDLDELEGDKGKVVKGCVSFRETEKQWALNKTNGICLRAMFGKKIQEGWIGKRVTLFAGTWNGEDAIRVWGSPELEKDMEVEVALPRRRAFNMTMHAVRKDGNGAVTAARSGAAAKGEADPVGDRAPAGSLKALPGQQEAQQRLRAHTDLAAFIADKKSLWALYAAAGEEVPLEVEAAAHIHREHLESQDP